LQDPQAVPIEIDGIDAVKNVKKAQSIMGIVPDESNLYDEMDGFDNLCFCGSLYGMRKLSVSSGLKSFLHNLI
jgi:ABC-2 type transport system ATP-binding protein